MANYKGTSHLKQHAIDSTDDHSGSITKDNLVTGDSSGLPKDSGTPESDVTANTAARHAESHSIASHNDTTATGAELETLTDGSNSDGLHIHSNVGNSDIKKNNFTATTIPTKSDDGGEGYAVGSQWWYAAARKLFICFDATTDDAIWKLIYSNCFVKNDTGSTITKGSVVYVSGASGAAALITKAKADAEATSATTLGFVLTDIDDNGFGYVVTTGAIYNVNTNGIAAGVTIYLSAATAGVYTDTAPTTPNHLVVLGKCIYEHSSQGIISINIMNGFETWELHDVDETPAGANEFLLSNGTKYSATNFDTEVSANSDVTANTTHRGSDGTDHGHIDQDVQTTASPTFVDVTFQDPNDDAFTTMDLSRHQLDAYNELATTEFDMSGDTAGSARTLTANQPETEKIEVILAEKKLEQPAQTDLTVDMTAFAGSDASPNDCYTYIQNDGGDEPEMVCSNTPPNGVVPHVDGLYEVVGAVSASSTNIYASLNKRSYIHEKIEKIIDAMARTTYESGLAITSSAAEISITSGVIAHVVQGGIAVSGLTLTAAGGNDNQFVIEDDDTFVTYDTAQIDEYFDGTTFATGQKCLCHIGIVINSPDSTSARFHVVPQDGSTTYVTTTKAWADASNMYQNTPRNTIVKACFVPIMDVVISRSGANYTFGVHPDTGLYHRDRRGQVAAAGGGGGGGAAQNTYETFTGDSGTSTASIPTDSMAVVGGRSITTTVTNDQVSVETDKLIHFGAEIDNGNSGAADTIVWTAGNKQKSTLTDDCTYTFTNPGGACNLILKIIQGGTGSYTVTWDGDVKWSTAGTPPTLSTAIGAIDIVSFYFDGTNYYGQVGLDFQ